MVECKGARANLSEPVQVSVRNQEGIIRVGCPFVAMGVCVANSDQLKADAAKTRVLYRGRLPIIDEECIHGDGKKADIISG